MVDGRVPKQVALDLGISVETVRTHLKNAKRRTSSRTLAELVANCGRQPVQQFAWPDDRLTPRQIQVGSMLADGNSLTETANALRISPRTVEMHVTDAKKRLGGITTAQLAAALSSRSEHMRSSQSSAAVNTSSTVLVPLPRPESGRLVGLGDFAISRGSLLARTFVLASILVGVSSVAALVLRFFPMHAGQSPALASTVIAAVLPVAALVGCWRARSTAALVGGRASFQLAILVCVLVLVADPGGDLWWPASALLMLLVVVAPPRRTLVCCLAAVLVSASAQLSRNGLASALSVSSITIWFNLLVLPVGFMVAVRTLIRMFELVDPIAADEIELPRKVVVGQPAMD